MTRQEFINKVTEIAEMLEERFDDEGIYRYIGFRYEDKEREIGEIIMDKSRSNIDREDERDYPAYGTPEYDSLPELNGICTYDAKAVKRIMGSSDPDDTFLCPGDHCYIVASTRKSDIESGEDDHEFILDFAEVMYKVF